MASREEPVRLKGCAEIDRQEVSLEVVSDIVTSYLSGHNRNLKLLIVGETGQGKSTLINGLVGKQVAKEGDSFSAGTSKIKHYSLNQNGVAIEIWDTPGFGYGSVEEDTKMVETLSMHEWHPDLTLFCFRMDSTRFPTRLHSDTIKKLTEVFGKSFWNHTLFVLTFANNVSQLCPENEEFEEFFSNRVCILEEKVQKTLQEEVGLSDDELKNVKAVPVGTYRQGRDRQNQWELPGRDDWFLWFWMECVEHMKQASVSALLQANCHRLNEKYGGNPSSTKEIFERSVGGTVSTSDPPLEDLSLENNNAYSSYSSNDVQTVYADENFTASDQSDDVHSQAVPFTDILLAQLDDNDSSFFTYVWEYSKKRGGEIWVIGHLAGLIEGLVIHFGKNSRLKKLQAAKKLK